MHETRFRPVVEVSYLTTENTARYRTILHFMYREYKQYHNYLDAEEILVYMQSQPFETYSDKELQADLKQLVEWNNLIPRQETGRVFTVEDFNKRRFRYQCTEYTIRIEAMLESLTSLSGEYGSLEITPFDRLAEALRSLSEAGGGDGGQLSAHWDDVFMYFERIVRSTSEYFRLINSERMEEQMQQEAFLAYKDRFCDNLRKFIRRLQQMADVISLEIRKLSDPAVLDEICRQIVLYREENSALPRFNKEGYTAEMNATWRNLRYWFIQDTSRRSELKSLLSATEDTIRKITRYVQILADQARVSKNRSHDYKRAAQWFDSMSGAGDKDALNECHKFAALLFGAFHVRHFWSFEPKDALTTNLWTGSPGLVPITRRAAAMRGRTRKTPVLDRSEEKDSMARTHLEERKQEQEYLAGLMIGGKLAVRELAMQPAFVRFALLEWIAGCLASDGAADSRGEPTAGATTYTEQGFHLRLTKESNMMVTVPFEDGDLTMPDFVFEVVTG